jgi:hypothetical protein
MVYAALPFLVLALTFIVAAMMVYRKLYKEFPFFFTYVVIVIMGELLRQFIFHRGLAIAYFYTYWITEALEVVLGFLVLYEVFLIRLFPQFNVTVIYRWTLLCIRPPGPASNHFLFACNPDLAVLPFEKRSGAGGDSHHQRDGGSGRRSLWRNSALAVEGPEKKGRLVSQ